jgi:hypothetical protein
MQMIIGPYGAQHHNRCVTLLSNAADGKTAGPASKPARNWLAIAAQLSKPQQLMRLDAETPPWMSQAIGDRVARVLCHAGSIHRLEKEIVEREVLEQARIEIWLRENELELAPAFLNQVCA